MAKLAGGVPVTSDHGRPGISGLHTALVAGAAFAFVVGVATSADAQYRRNGYWAPAGYGFFGGYAPEPYYRRSFKKKRTLARPSADQPGAVGSVNAAKKANPERDGFVDIPKGGVLQIAISINSQRLSLYRDGVRVGQSPVSTGTASHPTPTGVFSVIEKDRWHRSNLYGNAPMWFMQRVTWSGVAMHEGVLPGYAASHGCIRLPREFAARLWPTTRLGARVVIARGEVAPVDFQHAKLFAPAPKPAEPKVAMIAPVEAASAGRPVRLAEAGTIANDASPVAAKPAAIEPADAKPADVKPSDSSPIAAKPAAAGAEDGKPADTTAAAPGEGVEPADTAAAPTDVTPAAGASAEAAAAADPAVPAPAETVNATGAIVTSPAEATAPVEANDLRKAVEAPQASEPSAPVQAAPAGDEPVKPAPAVTDPLKPTAPRTKAADQPAKRSGQVAVFVSRKEKKIFVRQGFIPVFDMPITIENPDQPLGTHVFTALALTNDGAAMRWNLITMPTGFTEPRPERTRKADGRRKTKEVPVVDTRTPSTAAEALDRIQMPPEAVERISELLIPGSSLVVSDEGLGKETGRYTEFIVLTR